MAKLTLSKASKVFGKDRKTLYRHINQGKLSRDSDGKIDTAELIRVYGEPQNNATEATMENNEAKPQSATPHAPDILRHQISDLKEQMKVLREDKDRQIEALEADKERLWSELEEEQKERRQALRLLEDKQTKEEAPPKSDRWLIWGLSIASVGLVIASSIALYFLSNS